MPLSDDKLVQMAENVASIKSHVESHGDRLRKVEEKVDKTSEDLGEMKLSLETQSTEIRIVQDEVKKVAVNGLGSINLSLKTVLKVIGALIAVFIAGSAGGQGLMELIKSLLGQ